MVDHSLNGARERCPILDSLTMESRRSEFRGEGTTGRPKSEGAGSSAATPGWV